MKTKPHLHILQSKRNPYSFVNSPYVQKKFQVTKGDKIKGQPDLIFCQTYASSCVLDELLKTKIPYVVHMGGDVWSELSKTHPEKLNRIQAMLKRAKYIITVTRFFIKTIEKHLDVPIKVLAAGYWGVDHTPIGLSPSRFSAKQHHKGFPRLAMMQINLSVEKKYRGIPIFFDAIAGLREKYPMVFCCIGDIKRKDLAKQWGKKYGIHFRSKVPDWPKELGRADIFVHPSMYDTWSRSVSEAFCCGIPVFSFDIGGVPEISDRLFLVDPNDKHAIRTKFEQFCQLDRASWGSISRNEALEKTALYRHNYCKLLLSCLGTK